MFEIGNKVKIINDNYCGIIKEINHNEILIINEYGFEEKFKSNEVVIFNNEIDYSFSNKNLYKKDIAEKKIILKKIERIEVDLHIGNLVDSFKDLSNFEMLQIQLKKINETIDDAIKNNNKIIIFIHGKGKGVLKNELHKILEERKILNFFDASYNKYKMGATEIRL